MTDPSLAMTCMSRNNACFRHTARLMSSCTLVAYSVLSPDGEESFNKLSSPDPDHIRGGPNHGYRVLLV